MRKPKRYNYYQETGGDWWLVVQNNDGNYRSTTPRKDRFPLDHCEFLATELEDSGYERDEEWRGE